MPEARFKPSPGPWTVSQDYLGHPTVVNPEHCVANCKTHQGFYDEANARLIAAAPRMLETLKLVQKKVPMDPHLGLLVLQMIIAAEGE